MVIAECVILTAAFVAAFASVGYRVYGMVRTYRAIKQVEEDIRKDEQSNQKGCG